jgi:hypothetical protein
MVMAESPTAWLRLGSTKSVDQYRNAGSIFDIRSDTLRGLIPAPGTPVRWMNVDLHFVEASLVKVPSFLVVYKAALGFNLD